MTAYYNENDPKAAAWLRELIKVNAIAPGDVDERSIADVRVGDLAGYTQHHFFAGIGGWSYALRLAGWPDDRPVWTGSCPCQPFSSAGRGLGTADARHLWPVWRELIREYRPATVFGEQVASPAALAWLAVVQDDMEGAGYAFAPFDLPAAGIGAPHIRQRICFVADRVAVGLADCNGTGLEIIGEQQARGQCTAAERGGSVGHAANPDCGTGRQGSEDVGGGDQGSHAQSRAGSGGSELPLPFFVGHTSGARGGRNAGAVPCSQGTAERSVRGEPDELGTAGANSELANADRVGLVQHAQRYGQPFGGREEGACGHDVGGCSGLRKLADSHGRLAGHEWEQRGGQHGQQPQDSGIGFWSACDWIPCRDGKARPVEPGTFPLAHGVPGRVGLLRGYGNAIVAPLLAEFIASYLDLSK